MAVNLVDNVRIVFEGYSIILVYGWSDSIVVFYWIKGGGFYKQFVINRVRKISFKDFIEWRYVDSSYNLVDIGSRGCNIDQLIGMWLFGLEWLFNLEKWLRDIVIKFNKEIEVQVKRIKEVFVVVVDIRDDFDEVFEKYFFW